MATFKIAVRQHQKRRDGRYPVSIRIIHKSRIGYIPTGYYVSKSQLTRKFELNDALLGKELNGRIFQYEKVIIELGLRSDSLSVKEIISHIEHKTVQCDEIEFFAFAEHVIEKMKSNGRIKPAINYNTSINNLEKFLKRRRLYFPEITSNLLREWEQWMRANNVGERAPSLYIGTVRTLFNLAVDEFNDDDTGVIRILHNPFGRYKIPRQNTAKKRGLDSDSIKRIRDCLPKLLRAEFARDMFMLSFYLAGTNSVDLFNSKDLMGGRLIYERTKTRARRADKAEIQINIEPEAFPLFEKYRDVSCERVFDFHTRYTTAEGFNTAINKGLKHVGAAVGIDSLQFYAARHSWATIALNECDIPKSDVHEFLNHVDTELRVTELYTQKDWGRLARANRKVLDRLITPDL